MTSAITERTIDGDRILRAGGLVLVASISHPGQWHDVTTGTCDCKGFQVRGTCRHLVRAAADEDRTERGTTLKCTACGRTTSSRLYGGRCSRCISNFND